MREQIEILSNAETTECRELTTQELDRVTGAYSVLTLWWAMYGSDNIYTAEVDTGRRLSK